MNAVLWVGLGGGLGSIARYLVTSGTGRFLGPGHPIGTLTVNVLGSLVIGFLTVFVMGKLPDDHSAKAFAVTGFLGGFTTYSAYALDIVGLMQKGENVEALVYALGTMVVCVMACIGGMVAARLFMA